MENKVKYSSSQAEAVSHYKGPALVLAGPGSGKTLVITQRTRYLIEHYGVNPAEILVITFTKAAAAEMRERFFALWDTKPGGVTFGTFHAVFFQILKYAYHFTADSIFKEEQKTEYIRELVRGSGLEPEDENDLIEAVIAEISLVKGGMLDLEHYYSGCCPEEDFRSIYRKYDNMLRANRLLDFDDMLVVTYELLAARPDILAGWQRKYRYILVDEFQDINLVQYEIVKMLARPENNLFIVGDDDQSVYRFRGARPEIMLEFKKQYPGCKEILLDNNYRSAKEIIDAAGRVISENKNRFGKKIRAVTHKKGSVVVCCFPTPLQENMKIISEVRRLHEDGMEWKDMAVLFRTNQGARALVEKLLEYQIPFNMKDRLPNLFEHWIARDLFGYIELARGSRERRVFLQIMNRPKRYISRDAVEPQVSFEHLKKYYEDRDWMYDRIDRLEYDIRVMATMPPFAAVTYLRNAVGYEAFLKEYAAEHRIAEDELIHILDELKESAKSYRDYESWFAHIEEYRRLLHSEQQAKPAEHEGIEIATLHGAKGLEYRAVFIPDVNEGVIPHHKANLDENIEEERRLFYVGMTRAKEKLYLGYVKERYNKELEPSRFLNGLHT